MRDYGKLKPKQIRTEKQLEHGFKKGNTPWNKNQSVKLTEGKLDNCIEEIVALHKAGMKTKDIADKFNCSSAAISSRLTQQGFRINNKNEIVYQGKTRMQLAKELGVKWAVIDHHLKKHGHLDYVGTLATEQQKKKVHTPLGVFACASDAAKQHGVGASCISNRARHPGERWKEYYYV